MSALLACFCNNSVTGRFDVDTVDTLTVKATAAQARLVLAAAESRNFIPFKFILPDDSQLTL